MPTFPRSELEEMVERWLQVNREAEAKGGGDSAEAKKS